MVLTSRLVRLAAKLNQLFTALAFPLSLRGEEGEDEGYELRFDDSDEGPATGDDEDCDGKGEVAEYPNSLFDFSGGYCSLTASYDGGASDGVGSSGRGRLSMIITEL